MPHFYFNYRDETGLSTDDVGIHFESLDDAYLDAFRSAQELWGELLRQRRDPLSAAFEIADEQGMTVLTLPFAEVLDAAKRHPRRPAVAPGARWLDLSSNEKRARRLLDEVKSELLTMRSRMDLTRRLLAGIDTVDKPAPDADRREDSAR